MGILTRHGDRGISGDHTPHVTWAEGPTNWKRGDPVLDDSCPAPGSLQAPYASPRQRYGARVIDTLVAQALAFGPFAVFLASGREGLGLTLIPVGIGAAIIHEVVGTALWGRTLGKKIQGIKVVRVEDGGVPRIGRALRRQGWMLVAILPLGVLFRRDRRGFHDRRAGTVVVQVARRR